LIRQARAKDPPLLTKRRSVDYHSLEEKKENDILENKINHSLAHQFKN
jgi:hypothetical protein